MRPTSNSGFHGSTFHFQFIRRGAQAFSHEGAQNGMVLVFLREIPVLGKQTAYF
jgi:hypothetical protein